MSTTTLERNTTEYNSGLTLQIELDALEKMKIEDWRFRVDQNLQYFTREYVLEENITRYSYSLRRDTQGLPCEIYSPGFEEDGDILNSFGKGIGERARAEYEGFQKIEKKIFQEGLEDNFFVWVSPPGLADEGFGTHSYTFIGHIVEDQINMVAYKNWLDTSSNIHFLNKFLPDNNQLEEGLRDVDFLKNPVFLKGGERFQTHLDVIRALDPERSDLKEGQNNWLLGTLCSYRKAIILALENGDLEEAERAKVAHDNYAVALLQGKDNGIDDIDHWASQSAVVLRGSCGFSRSKKSGSIISTWFGVEKSCFNCPRCDGEIQSGKGITVCPHCGARKEEFQNKCD